MQMKKGDTVKVVAGKDAGKTGKVLKVIPDAKRLVVEGVNRVKKHQRPNRAIPQGGIQKIESSMDGSNVMLVCSKCKKPTRIGHKVLGSEEKVRVCKKCGEILD